MVFALSVGSHSACCGCLPLDTTGQWYSGRHVWGGCWGLSLNLCLCLNTCSWYWLHKFSYLQVLKQAGLQRYEVSNFCIPVRDMHNKVWYLLFCIIVVYWCMHGNYLQGCESHHNLSYWKGRNYLGIGPGNVLGVPYTMYMWDTYLIHSLFH